MRNGIRPPVVGRCPNRYQSSAVLW